MNDNKFMVQVIAKGAFIDDGVGDGKSYMVEACILRFNHVALNTWLLSEIFNCRECYRTAEEWEKYRTKQKAKREAVKKQILEALGLDPNTGSVHIAQSLSEVFTVVHIREI